MRHTEIKSTCHYFVQVFLFPHSVVLFLFFLVGSEFPHASIHKNILIDILYEDTLTISLLWHLCFRLASTHYSKWEYSIPFATNEIIWVVNVAHKHEIKRNLTWLGCPLVCIWMVWFAQFMKSTRVFFSILTCNHSTAKQSPQCSRQMTCNCKS